MKTLTFVAISSVAAISALGAQQVPDISPYLIADRAAEVALARTAAPSAISDSATILVLTTKGYVEAAHGTNGFTCAVIRSFGGAPNDPQFWNPRTLAPLCFNPPAVRTILPAVLTRINWSLAGAKPADLTSRVAKAYAEKQFVMPAAGAMAYMLSPQQHLSDEDPHWMPHLMFYYDRSITGSTFGASGPPAPMIDATGPDSTAAVQVVLIPTRAWSDGTPAMPTAPAK